MKAMFISAALLASALAFANEDVKKADKTSENKMEKPPAKAFGATNPKADINDKYTETYKKIENKADAKAPSSASRSCSTSFTRWASATPRWATSRRPARRATR
jgi:hypothetical protein